jgi:excisionase family DNA binding protein
MEPPAPSAVLAAVHASGVAQPLEELPALSLIDDHPRASLQRGSLPCIGDHLVSSRVKTLATVLETVHRARYDSGMDAPALMTEQELADYCRVSLVTVKRWRRAGTGPPVVYAGEHPRYRKTAVDEWLERRGRRDAPEMK